MAAPTLVVLDPCGPEAEQIIEKLRARGLSFGPAMIGDGWQSSVPMDGPEAYEHVTSLLNVVQENWREHLVLTRPS